MADENPQVWADQCDLVLKGGITSGVVYPLAIAELAKAFRLRSIGGTSAGAIAAAAAAAAECGRQRRGGKDFESFRKLEQLPEFLGSSTGDGATTRLLGFFKPAPPLAPLFEAFLATLARGKGKWQRAWLAIAVLWRASGWRPWLVLAVGVLLVLPLARSWSSVPAALVLLLAAWVAAVLVVLWRAATLALDQLPAHGFGVCSGLQEGAAPESGQALTDWLADYLDELSGQALGQPLTFGDLEASSVDLQVMTTCLTLGRPFRLPFRNDEQVRENNSFWWSEEDFRKLFPPRVVDWMKAHQRPPGTTHDLDEGLLRLPEPADMPVVVGVRMSLSFPVLLSAVPLYAFDHKLPDEVRKRERVWFTDGGIASNFPIHFFDAPLPSRPTFGIDLGHAATEADAGDALPYTNNDARVGDWQRFSGQPQSQFVSFLLTLFAVAKDWNHDTLSRLPGFRDRIGLIRLTERQGGLNLNMPPELIRELSGYGRNLGMRFVRRFGNPDAWPADVAQLEKKPVRLDWENHQLIRFRLLFATEAEFLEALEKVLETLQGQPANYDRFLVPSQPRRSYQFEWAQAQLARPALEKLRDLARLVGNADPDASLAKGAPKPTPELKVRPRV